MIFPMHQSLTQLYDDDFFLTLAHKKQYCAQLKIG